MAPMTGDELWPQKDYTRVPYRLFTDAEIYAQEQQKIFRGPIWNYVGLEAEIPNPGDFKTTFVGETPVIINRTLDGSLAAMVNRCAHRGAIVRREPYGNARDHRCIYHKWAYSLTGDIRAIPFKTGVRGKGGLDAEFREADHGLTKLLIESFKGMMFVSFDPSVEPLHDYLGEMHREHIARIMFKPVKVLGFQRQLINGNWKFYQENLRDTYHASLLHSFFSTFGLDRVTNPGGTMLDASKRHAMLYNRHDPAPASPAVPTDSSSSKAYAANGLQAERVTLEDKSILQYHNEYGDDMRVYIACVFPNGHYQQMNNCLNTRQLIPRGPESFEVVWTIFGYQDDDEAMTDLRKHQANFIGPAGLVSMEDAEVIENLQSTLKNELEKCAVVEMGGRGPITMDNDNKVNEIPIRGFWSGYSRLMGLEPTGAER
jgi:anthranilate 1,2-dioxygenase large subunit